MRDALAGRPSEDWDLTTRAHPNQVRRLFRRTVPVGIAHGTVGILSRDGTLYEVTTFRRDVETSGRHAVVAFAETLDEDLARRDFTINAVAWHPLTGALHDPHGGRADLEAGILRTVGDPAERFAEDYLRVLRALRFAGRFSLSVEPATWRALCGAVPSMGRLSPERVREELDKVLGSGERPSAALSLYAASGALAFFYPELDEVIDRFHPSALSEHPSPWLVALRALDFRDPADIEGRLAILLAASMDTAHAVAILTRLRSSNRRIRDVGAMAGALATVLSAGGRWGPSPPERRAWLSRVGRPLASRVIPLLSALQEGLQTSDQRHAVQGLVKEVLADLRSGIPLSVEHLAISGRDLIRAGHRPGPHFGKLFEVLLQDVQEEPSRNEVEWLLDRAHRLLAGPRD